MRRGRRANFTVWRKGHEAGFRAAGFWRGGDRQPLSAIADEEAQAVVAKAWAAGLRAFDTAPHYGFGLSEKRLGAALAALDPGGTAILFAKEGRRLDPAPDADLSQMRQGFVSPEPDERIDILHAHDIGSFAHGRNHPALMRQFLDGGFRAMAELKAAGAVRAIGIGFNEIAVCEEMLGHADIDLILLAGRYMLFEQAALYSLFPICAARGAAIPAGVPCGRYRHSRHRTGAPSGCGADMDGSVHPAAFWRALRDEGLIDEAAPLPDGE